MGRGPGAVRVFVVKAPGVLEALARALEEAQSWLAVRHRRGAELVVIPGMGHVNRAVGGQPDNDCPDGDRGEARPRGDSVPWSGA